MRGAVRTGVLALLLVVMVACSDGSSGTDNDGPLAGASGQALGPEPTPAGGVSHDTDATPANNGACAAGQLRVRVVHQPPDRPGGAEQGVITLTNDTATPCTLSGWPQFALADEDGDDIAVNVAKTGRPIPVRLARGQTAFAGLRWSVCSDRCTTGAHLRLGPPGGGSSETTLLGFPPSGPRRVALGSPQVGPIQAGTANIFSW